VTKETTIGSQYCRVRMRITELLTDLDPALVDQPVPATRRWSRAQMAAMDWSADPSPFLDHLHMFGPSPVDIME